MANVMSAVWQGRVASDRMPLPSCGLLIVVLSGIIWAIALQLLP